MKHVKTEATYVVAPVEGADGLPECTNTCGAFGKGVPGSFIDMGYCCVAKRMTQAGWDCRPALIEMSRKLREIAP